MAVRSKMEYGVNIALRNRAMISVRRLRPRSRIVCLSGRLWVTFDRDPEDHLLRSGDSHLPSRAARGAIIYAAGPSELVVLERERVPVGAIIGRFLRRRFALRS